LLPLVKFRRIVMKKILVVLLVLSVATGVFAQEGEFSFSGTAEIGAVIDFDPDPAADESAMATSAPSHYNRLYDGYDGIKGSFGINYNRDVFGAGLTIRSVTWGDPQLVGNLNADGENYHFSVESDLTALISGGTSFRQLWGNYNFVNGIVFLEASYVRGWAGDQFWASDTVGAFRNWNGRLDEVIAGPFVDKHTFTMTDGNWEGGPSSYIAADIRLQGLNFGLMIRDIFLGDQGYVLDDGTEVTAPRTFVDDVLKKMIFGVKFDMSPIQVAAQFLMENYGVYVGGKWFVGPVTVGLSFMGILNEKVVDYAEGNIYRDNPDDPTEVTSVFVTKKNYVATNATKMKVGGGVNYDADGFGAVVKGFYAIDGDDFGKTTQIGVEPGFYYNVIPSHLQFKLDAGFYFFGFTDADGEKITDGVNTVQYALQPQLFWNFLGTGAGGYGGTGIFLRYRLVGGDADKNPVIGLNNKFDVNFKLSF
jgi:hypothetical protein